MENCCLTGEDFENTVKTVLCRDLI